MKKFFTILFLLIFTNLSFAADSGSNNNGSKSLRCPGEFANPISDICWSCIFPISMGGMPLWKGGQEDNSNPSQLFCSCAIPRIYLGIQTGFWEPVRQ